MRHTDRRHSVAGSPSKLLKKNSPKKTNARAVLAFSLKKILRFGRDHSPLPMPKLRPGGGGLSPIVTQTRMTRSESLPAMRLSFNSCADDQADRESAQNDLEGETTSEYEHFHADLCARVAKLAHDEETEEHLAIDEKYFTCEDGSDSMVQVARPEDKERVSDKSISMCSSRDEERVSDEMECELRFSPFDNSEGEEKTEDGQEETEFVSVVRPDEEKTGNAALTAQRILVGEVSYSPIHTSAYNVQRFMNTEGDDHDDGEGVSSFDLMLRQDDQAAEEDDVPSIAVKEEIDIQVEGEEREGSASSNDFLEVAADESSGEESVVSELALSSSTSDVLIVSSDTNEGQDVGGWESAASDSSHSSLVEDGASTCSIHEQHSTPLSLAGTNTSSSDVVGGPIDNGQDVEVGGPLGLALGMVDGSLELFGSMNRNTRSLAHTPQGNGNHGFVQLPRIEEGEVSSENASVEAEMESISSASSTPVSTFDSSMGGDEEGFTELLSSGGSSFYTSEAMVFDEFAEDPEPAQLLPREATHCPRPFRFDDAIHEEQRFTNSASNQDADIDFGGLKLSPEAPQSSFAEESKEQEKEDGSPVSCHSVDENSAQAASRFGTKMTMGLLALFSIPAVLGGLKMISSSQRVADTHQLTNTDCRKFLRELGWIKNHQLVKADAYFPGLDGAVWNASDLLSAPCEVVLATQTPEEIAAYERKMHQVYEEMEAESRGSNEGGVLGSTGVEGKLILCLAFTLLAWALLQYDSLP